MIEGPKLHGLETKQLNNRNFTEELKAALDDGVLTKQEARELYEVFSEKRNKIYSVSKSKLNELRKIIDSTSRHGWLTDRDMKKLEEYSQKFESQPKTEQKQEKTNNFDKYPTIKYPEELLALFSSNEIPEKYVDKVRKWKSKTIKIHFKNESLRVNRQEFLDFYDNVFKSKKESKKIDETKKSSNFDMEEWNKRADEYLGINSNEKQDSNNTENSGELKKQEQSGTNTEETKKESSEGQENINTEKKTPTLLERVQGSNIHEYPEYTGVDLRTDSRFLRMRRIHRREASWKNNNPAGLTWAGRNSRFARLMKENGIQFFRGTKRPKNEGGYYIGFPDLENGMKAYELLLKKKFRSFRNKTVKQLAENWAYKDRVGAYRNNKVFRALWNKKVGDLTESQKISLLKAQLLIESPGLGRAVEKLDKAGKETRLALGHLDLNKKGFLESIADYVPIVDKTSAERNRKYEEIYNVLVELSKEGNFSKYVVAEYLKKHNIDISDFNSWMKVKGVKLERLTEVMSDKKETKEYTREKEIYLLDTYKQFLDFIHKHRVDKMSTSYRRTYEQATKNALAKEFPEEGYEILDKFNNISLQQIKDSLPKEFNKRSLKLITENFSEIKLLLKGGVIRAIKNFHAKYPNVDINKIPITINVPIATYKGGRKNASLSFTYNPKTGKPHIELWSYSFHKNWSNRPGSGGTTLGTDVIYIRGNGTRTSSNIDRNVWSKHAMYGYVYVKDGLELGLNNNDRNRGIFTHSIIKSRRNRIKRGEGSTTLGCSAYATLGISDVYKKSKARYAIEETTYPIL